MIDFNVLLFNDFETLDVFGPVEVVGKLTEFCKIEYYSMHGGIVRSSQNVRVDTLPISEVNASGIFLIPGGLGTRYLVSDIDFIEIVENAARQATYVLTVCTGSALLAKTGLLKKRDATTNKVAFEWVCSLDKEVNWIRKARWVRDGVFYTSSGVSAGIDMTLSFISDLKGIKRAEDIAKNIEYVWNKDKDNDLFA